MGHTTFCPQNLDPLCARIKKIFGLFGEHPEELQHLLLYGPPGSGKTSTVEWLLEKIWGSTHMKIQTCRFLNAADERSLDAIRAKIIPFVSADWRDPDDTRPRFLVLDECETLTESAQLALRPLLDKSPQDLCIIFICNSLSRVQVSLRTRCLRIRFDPPSTSSLQTHSMRGDLRNARIQRNDISNFLAFLHNTSQPHLTAMELVQAGLFFCTSFHFMDNTVLDAFRPLLKIGIDSIPGFIIDDFLNNIRAVILQKFDSLAWQQVSIRQNADTLTNKPKPKQRIKSRAGAGASLDTNNA
jgi:DNA polymerase III delta prime subunit